MSRALIQSGFEVLSIDHVSDSPMAPIVVLDLTTSAGQTILWEIPASDRLFSAHLGLPCGTSSKARERPVPERLRRMGVPSPKPLRSAEYPMGVPQLSELDRLKVEKANVLYQLGLEIVLYLTKRHIIVSVENPFGSWLWAVFIRLTLTKSLEDRRIYNSLEMVQFHSCCHGSKRRKDTGWLSTPGVYTVLNAVCQNDHPHEPWGVSWQFGQWRFDTSTESAYPTLLAQRAAACLVKRATSDGLTLQSCVRLHDLATASTGKQTKKHKPLIPEYHHVSTQAKNLPIPDGAKILAPHLGGGSEEVASTNDSSSFDKLKLADQNKLGHFHSPKQFISRAKVAQHPMDSTEHLEDATLFSIQYNLQHSHELIKLERKKNLLQAKLLGSRRETSDEDMRRIALAKLRDLVMGDPAATRLGLSLQHILNSGGMSHVIEQSFSDCFRAKASSTLQKRANSLWKLSLTLAELGSLHPLRFSEEQLYNALCLMREKELGATSGQHVIEALHFLDSTAGCTMCNIGAVISGRCRGVARDMFLFKDPLSRTSSVFTTGGMVETTYAKYQHLGAMHRRSIVILHSYVLPLEGCTACEAYICGTREG